MSAGSAVAQQIERTVEERIDAILDEIVHPHEFESAIEQVDDVFQQVIAFAKVRDDGAFRRCAGAKRMLGILAQADESIRLELLDYLRANRELADALAFSHDPYDRATEGCDLLNRLRVEHGEKLNAYPFLTAAICWVHDEELSRRINEHPAKAPDPVDIFEYFVQHEDKLSFGVKSVPTELLVYVVDTTATIEEMKWALARYAGDPHVGARFFDIEYDYHHYLTGAPKKVTQAGWNLPNILEYGGVCADQAYYAMAVGKAIGVPTAYAVGRGADVGHAWVGFLQAKGRQAWWNFDIGRYEAYQGLSGMIENPQNGGDYVSDSEIAVLAEMALGEPADRYAAVAFFDAARILYVMNALGQTLDPPPFVSDRPMRTVRDVTNDSQLALMEAGLRHNPGYVQGWTMLAMYAKRGQLTLRQKKEWAGVLDRLCGGQYPHFSLSILIPMVETIDEIEEQNDLWNNAFRAYSHRADLAARIRMAQARMWEEAGEHNKAGQCYEDVITRYANAGPFVVRALRMAEDILIESNQAGKIPLLYAQTWQRIKRPEEMAGQFIVQSNWFRVGRAYADKLDEAGRTNQARNVRDTIGLK